MADLLIVGSEGEDNIRGRADFFHVKIIFRRRRGHVPFAPYLDPPLGLGRLTQVTTAFTLGPTPCPIGLQALRYFISIVGLHT